MTDNMFKGFSVPIYFTDKRKMSNTLTKNLLVRRIAILVFTSFSMIAHCQVISYMDSLNVGKYKGMADFQYKVVENDTILDGPFQLQRSNLGALLSKSDYSFLFKGVFKENYPNGYWKFQFGEFQSDSITQVLDYQYILNITGTQEEAEGILDNGKPDGIWTITKNRIKDSELDEVLFKSTIDFENGVPQKSFRIENEGTILVGRFLRNGLAHDEWTLYSEDDIDVVERWYFKDGRLEKIELNADGENKEINLYQSRILDGRIITLDDNYLKILSVIQQSVDTFDLSQSPINKSLAANAGYYGKIDGILSELGESAFYPEFKVKVPYHPIDSLESAQMDSVKTLYQKSKLISESLLNDTQLTILKMADEDAHFLHSVVVAISENFVHPLGDVLSYHESNILQYVPINELIEHAWPNGKPSTEFVVIGQKNENKIFKGPQASDFDFTQNNIASIYKMAHYATLSLDSIQQVLNDKLTKDKRQQEFIALEERIIAQVNQLNNDLDSLSDKLPLKYMKSFEKIKSTADQNLTRYSKMEETKAKTKFGRHLVRCFESMDILTKALAQQPDRMQVIKEKYQDAIWNPFMANIMNEEVKKRITSAYQRVLIPHLLDRVETELDCDNVDELVGLLNNTHQRMLEMRDEDTSRLERKLKREQDPLVIIQLFNLESIGKTEK